VISPNGKRIAFVSKRPAKPGQPESKSQDIWVVNIDGTGLRRVTRPQTDGRGDSYIRALAWSPDSNMLAFRGRRLVKDGETSTLREVLGFIQPNGAKESGIRIDDCGGGSVVDWVGDSVLYSLGGAVQGCFSTYYLVRTYSTGVTVEIPAPALGSASNGPGAARLSPRATHVVWTSYAPINQARLARIRIDGTGLSEVVTGSIAPGEWLWWRPGPRLTAPKSYRMETPSVTLRAGRGGQLEPVLRDRNRTVLSRSGQDWTWIDRMPGGTISTTGWLSTSSTTPPGTYRAQIVNAGFTATVTITVR
jgi:dipeptidyl aminopeptidase/acylaminoacyl peptidase